MADDFAMKRNLGHVIVRGCEHISAIGDATDPHQWVVPLLTPQGFKLVQSEIFLGGPSWLKPSIDNFPAGIR